MLILASYLDQKFKTLYFCTVQEKSDALKTLMEIYEIVKYN